MDDIRPNAIKLLRDHLKHNHKDTPTSTDIMSVVDVLTYHIWTSLGDAHRDIASLKEENTRLRGKLHKLETRGDSA